MDEFIQLILLFFIYSGVGWLWETIYCSLKARHFVYRGFLVGPITPIYGFGILGVLYFLEPFKNQLLMLFLLATVLVTVLEYITSWGLEKLFHASWWDYHNVPLNINGRVAVPVSIFWGVCCVLIVRVIHPYILVVEGQLAQRFGIYLPILLLMLISLDMGYTLANLAAFQKSVQKISQAIDKNKEALQEELSQQKAQWQAKIALSGKEAANLKASLPRLNFHQRRLLKNFQNLSFKDIKSLKEIRELVEELRKK